MRKKIAIIIDYSIRIPNFQQTYNMFKDFIFKDNLELESDEESIMPEDTVRFFWKNELDKPDVVTFYSTKNPEKIMIKK